MSYNSIVQLFQTTDKVIRNKFPSSSKIHVLKIEATDVLTLSNGLNNEKPSVHSSLDTKLGGMYKMLEG